MNKVKNKGKSLEELLEEALVPVEEQPYEVPRNWIWTKLVNVVETQKNRNPKNLESETFRYVDIDSVDNLKHEVRLAKELLVKDAPSRAIKALRKNDVIISLVRPYLKNVAMIEEEDPFLVGSSAFYICTSKNSVIPQFLYYLLLSPYTTNYLNKHTKGDNSPSVRNSDFEIIKIPLPPIEEQKRIANKIESLFAKIDEAKQLIDEAKESFELRRAAILDKAFRGELTKNWRDYYYVIEGDKADSELNTPLNWREVLLSEIVKVNPARAKLSDISDEQECTFVPMGAVSEVSGEIEAPESKSFSTVKKGYTYFEENDIIFAKITPCMENGKVALATNLINGFGFGSTEFHVIRAITDVNIKYIYYILRSSKFRFEAKQHMTGAVGQQRVPKMFLEEYTIQLPPKIEQDKIVEFIENVMTLEDQVLMIEQLQDEIKILKQSILQKAFRGELDTNDPTEESAIELLKESLKKQLN